MQTGQADPTKKKARDVPCHHTVHQSVQQYCSMKRLFNAWTPIFKSEKSSTHWKITEDIKSERSRIGLAAALSSNWHTKQLDEKR